MAVNEFTYNGSELEVSKEMKDTFDDNGYVIIRNLFCKEEVNKIEKTILEGGLHRYAYQVHDTKGCSLQTALWQNPGNDVTGMVARCEKVVTTAEKEICDLKSLDIPREHVLFSWRPNANILGWASVCAGGVLSWLLDVEITISDITFQLMGLTELYQYHGKTLIKDPDVGGSLKWHQDYGIWYKYCARPDMVAFIVAIDECTQENGGLKILRGTHKCGRINHIFADGQHGADMDRVELLMKQYTLDSVNLNPGDGIFFHGNLLHCSGQNNSKKRRMAMNVSYNEKSNSPVTPDVCSSYTKIDKVPNSAVMECENYTDFTGKNFVQRGREGILDLINTKDT